MQAKRRLPLGLAWLAIMCLTPSAGFAGEPFPVDFFAFPFRSAATADDIYALRFNPAGLAASYDVELAYLHHFTRSGPGGNHALVLRAKTMAAAVTWVEDRWLGNRREYLLGAGGNISPYAAFGLRYRYFKADDPGLQNKSTLAAALRATFKEQWHVAVVWDNPTHTKINGRKTRGTFTAAVSTQPIGPLLRIALDWTYPEGTRLDETELRLSGRVFIVPRLTAHFFIDTEDRVGLELRLLQGRHAGGVQMRFLDHTDWSDGTVYISGRSQPYPNSEPKPVGPRRY